SDEIAILGPRRLENSALAGVTRLGGLRVRPFGGNDPRAVSYGTIHSFKGLERTAVILVDITEEMRGSSDGLLYVGMSRARSRLLVLIHEASKPWFDAMQARHLAEAIVST